ncbi:hypothetical protein [Ochrobactrum chromiisoli]|uniref:Uncharacterized protein n=1 Tax=Ochrobactrum chromiisoli TaxID=2993941 RepID=A0ABT3QP71_9HYPH|nr:hypothetical protein [Ochrobactrum chromiisoli]MCX2697421.1 hypothetical protein [Ochrobactrum chromiisoli]
MYHGFCSLLIDDKHAGDIEYRFNNTEKGFLWLEEHLHHSAFQARSLALNIDNVIREITIRISTRGEATPFSFKSLPSR